MTCAIVDAYHAGPTTGIRFLGILSRRELCLFHDRPTSTDSSAFLFLDPDGVSTFHKYET
jgi:hypothetical protein